MPAVTSIRSLCFLALFTLTFAQLASSTTAAATPSTWTKRPDPVFNGQFVASDPSLIRDGDGYRMSYTCFDFDLTPAFDPDTTRAAICQATSVDGVHWREFATADPAEPILGLTLRGEPGSWAEHLEGSFLLETEDGDELLYFSGYRHDGDPALGFPAALAVARSTDGGRTFARVGADPILAPTPGGYDNDAVYSPAIVPYADGSGMVYAGHCYTRCDNGLGVLLLAATSPDGLTWTKRDAPVLEALPDLPWTRDGVAEPALIQGPDGVYYLFFTALRDADRMIGLARSDSPFGPWEVAPDPILTPSNSPDAFDTAGVLAPDVRIEGDLARMWFLGTSREDDFAIGYAEAAWPFWPDDPGIMKESA